jgi:hypothetical protein
MIDDVTAEALSARSEGEIAMHRLKKLLPFLYPLQITLSKKKKKRKEKNNNQN